MIFLLFSFFSISTALYPRGTLQWQEYGHTSSLKLAAYANGGSSVIQNDKVDLHLQWGPHVHYKLADNSDFYRFGNMIGDSLSFTVDLSQATCGCNAALYFVEFPKGASESFYCDAQMDPPKGCVELDVVEANKYAFQFTAHCADGTTSCKHGCAHNIRGPQGYGPGGSRINTNSPFDVFVSFQNSQINLKLSQGTKNIQLVLSDSYCGNSLISKKISPRLAAGNMGLVTSYWGMTDNWLDGCASASNTCPTSSHIYFSKLRRYNKIVVSAIDSDTSGATQNSSSGKANAGIWITMILGIVIFVVLVVIIVYLLWRRKSENTMEIA